VVMKTD